MDMDFRFEVNLTDNDYFEFNEFVMFKSHYGKKRMLGYKIAFVVITLVPALLMLIQNHFSLGGFISVLPLIIACVVIELLFPRVLRRSIKANIKSFKKNGKVPYTPNSVLEFFDQTIVETTDIERIERKYEAIERVSITDKVIYIHVNNLQAYILPIFSFASNRQYRDFLEFINQKCPNVDVY
jgi:hypothetical protein